MQRTATALLCVLLTLSFTAACGPDGPRQVKVGVVLPLTGAAQGYGVELRQGLEIAEQHLADDPEGPQLVLDIRDSGSDPQQGAALLEELYDDGATAVIGGVTSSEAAAMAPIAQDRQRLLLSPTASSGQLSDVGRHFFRIFPTDFDEASRMARFASEDLNLKKVTIIAPETRYGEDARSVFGSAFSLNQGELLDTIQYTAVGEPDYSALARQAMATSPEGIYLAGFAEAVGYLIAALRTSGFDGAILATSAYTPALSPFHEGTSGVYLTRTAYDIDAENPAMQRFVESFRARFNEDPDFFAGHGYDALLTVREALVRADGDQPANLWLHLRGIRDAEGVTGPLQFDEQGNVQRFPQIYLITEGELISYPAYQQRIRDRREELLRQLDENRRRQREMTRQQGDGG